MHPTCYVSECFQSHPGDAQLDSPFLAIGYCGKLVCAAEKKLSGSMQAWLYFTDKRICLRILPP